MLHANRTTGSGDVKRELVATGSTVDGLKQKIHTVWNVLYSLQSTILDPTFLFVGGTMGQPIEGPGKEESNDRAGRAVERMIHWFLWTAFVGALVPILLLALLYGLFKHHFPTGSELVGRGELYIVNLALVASGFSEIIGKSFGRQQRFRRGLANVTIVLLLVLALVSVVTWSAIVSQGVSRAVAGQVDTQQIPNWSYPVELGEWLPTWGGLATMVATILVGLLATGLGALAEEST
jgi:hypothetical protein